MFLMPSTMARLKLKDPPSHSPFGVWGGTDLFLFTSYNSQSTCVH